MMMRFVYPFVILLVSTCCPAALLGCSNTSDATGAAVAAGVAVAATGVHRAATKDCWGHCSKGYVCNQDTGLCEPGECIPTCPGGTSCTISPTGNTCLATKAPVFNPLTQTVRVNRLTPRESGYEPSATGPGTSGAPIQPVGDRNTSGQVAVPRVDPSTQGDASNTSPNDNHTSQAEITLRSQGAAVFEHLDQLREKWGQQAPYTSIVKDAQSAPLAGSRSLFARYLNTMHRSLDLIYTQGFLPRLETLPRAHALNNEERSVHLELILSGESGAIERVGLLRSSGNDDFDAGVLEAASLAGPFGAPPMEIRSSDGRVYVHWVFHRNLERACSTYFARPFILKLPAGQ